MILLESRCKSTMAPKYIYIYIYNFAYLKIPQQSVSSVKNHQAVYIIPPDDSLLMKQTVAEF